MLHQMLTIFQMRLVPQAPEEPVGDNTDFNPTTSLKLSNQALGAVMMALQESLLNEIDIVPILKGFELTQGDEGLVVTNPPTVRVSNNNPITEQDLTKLAGE